AFRQPPRHAADGESAALAPEDAGARRRHPEPRASAHAAPLVRLAPAAVQRRPARRAGAARPREHHDDAGLYQARFPASGEGVRRGASPSEEKAMKVITLRDGKERSLLRRHPWVFQGSIDKGKADAGETVRVQAADGRFLAWASYSPSSMIRVRAWSFD